ncbi:MAG: VTT domain-containing protein [Magnetococcales bacterium]|nr:VTT domain-containing protein [Magnetococcales bacterium]
MKIFLLDLIARLRRKAKTLLPIAVAAGLLSLLLVLIGLLLQQWLPDTLQHGLQLFAQNDFAANRDQFKAFMLTLGPMPELSFFVLQLLQVLFAPIPGQMVGILGGFLFGFWPSLLLTNGGIALGSWVAMVLSRRFGAPLVRRWVPPAAMKQFDSLINESRVSDFFMIFLLPALPDDAICFIAGLTRLPISQLVLAALIGRLPGLAVLTFAGSQVEGDLALAQQVFAVAMSVALVLWLYDDKMAQLVRKSRSRLPTDDQI